MRVLYSILATVLAVAAENTNIVYERGIPGTASNATMRPMTLSSASPFGVNVRGLPNDLGSRDSCLTGYDECDSGSCCDSTSSCCGIGCCLSGQTCVDDNAGYCCDSGETACGSTGCYNSDTEVCCQDNDGYHCDKGYTCCGSFCCAPGTTCSDSSTGTCSTQGSSDSNFVSGAESMSFAALFVGWAAWLVI
ncbi:hypothetical protein F5Y15DRAFT_81654 [Xylariaceae sp. FL0016]|nr:hypothetical protein F5Y15DRAFT_81654 [Xylariaceae sp. FL0016]